MTTQSSIQRDLDRLYKAVDGSDFSTRKVTKSAFTQARAKLDPNAFVEMSQTVLNGFYEQAPYLTFDGMRLLAIDGSRLSLPSHPSVVEEFGEVGYGPNADVMRSQCRISFIYDTLNLLVINGQMGPISVAEQTMMLNQMDTTQANDLLLMDRGYPSIWAFFLLAAKGTQFCARMNESWWHVVREFAESGEDECLVEFTLPPKDYDKLASYPDMQDKKLICRLVCVDLGNAEKEYLCTSLIDSERYPHEIFKELYFHRWGVEEAFKLYKERINIESFTGKTANAVRQDFYAKIFSMNYCSAMAHPIEQKLRKEAQDNRKYKRKINRTSAIALISETIVASLLKGNFEGAIKAFDLTTSKTTEIIRPGRSNPRKHRRKKQPSQNFKRL